jgi:xanthine dehydrogenase accessory factor
MEPLTPVPGASAGSTILTELLEAVQHRRAVALATIVATDRSVPRRAGSKMLVFAGGRTSGTIGGGEMEARVVAEALEVLVSGKSRKLVYSLVDAAAGDPGVCGGTVELFLEPHMPQPTVYVIGVGHVGQAVVELAIWLGYRVAAWDDRSDLAASVDTSTTEVEILSGSIHEALATNPIDEHTMVVMTTRNVGLDVEILPPLLASPASFIGIMGSQRRWEITREKLAATGETETNLDRVHSPIGIDINAETPVEIAVSILAEVIGHQRHES